jgi:hypothetical protein
MEMKRGFARLTPKQRSAIAKKGVAARLASGRVGHRWTSEEAKARGSEGARACREQGKRHTFTAEEAARSSGRFTKETARTASEKRHDLAAKRDPSITWLGKEEHGMEILYTEGYQFSDKTVGTTVLVRSGKWFVFADARAYNSAHKRGAKPYLTEGSGRLTMEMLRKHAEKVVTHAARQDACRFFEIYEVKKLVGPGKLVQMVFGS